MNLIASESLKKCRAVFSHQVSSPERFESKILFISTIRNSLCICVFLLLLSFFFFFRQRISYWARFYFRPFVHAGPYCIGFLAGYLLATKPNLKIPRVCIYIYDPYWYKIFVSHDKMFLLLYSTSVAATFLTQCVSKHTHIFKCYQIYFLPYVICRAVTCKLSFTV